MKKHLLLILMLLLSGIVYAQIQFPDSAAVIRNNVKVARIYFKSKDGKRYQHKELHYDKHGRIIIEREGDNSFYYAYTYDAKGRRTSSTQRSKDGGLIQKFTEEYDETNKLRTVYLFLQHDTLTPAYIYTYNAAGQKIRDEHLNVNGSRNIYTSTYNANGELVASYDSIGAQRIASYHEDGLLTKRRLYGPKGEFLREYRFTYLLNGKISSITDSSDSGHVVRYEMIYDDFGTITEYRRDKKKMPDHEVADFRKEFVYVFPFRVEEEMPYGLPVPELINEHHFTYDKKGNIIRDDLVQKQGSFSETYVYEYEYEFY